jgi:hypothetical protein
MRGMPVRITRAMAWNQRSEKFFFPLPTILAKAVSRRQYPVYPDDVLSA